MSGMDRRWLYRGLALTLLTVCVVAWVGSYWQAYLIRYFERPTYISANLAVGRLDIQRFVVSPDQDLVVPGRWLFDERVPNRHDWRAWNYRGLGFSYQEPLPPLSGWELTIPFWFPTLLSGLGLLLSWRKTKPKQIGRAFPIEPTAKPK